MYDSDDILDAARSIRPYLSELPGITDAEAIDQQLAELLAQDGSERSPDNEILALLASQEVMREWTLRFLQDKQQPEHLRNFSPLPGQPSIVSAAKFVCPMGDYVWYRPRVGVEPPRCPTHHVELESAP
jgi:hypothetical protein